MSDNAPGGGSREPDRMCACGRPSLVEHGECDRCAALIVAGQSPTLALARRIRAGENPAGPSRLHALAQQEVGEQRGGDLYRHAMIEAGWVARDLPKGAPFKPNDPCPICGHSFAGADAGAPVTRAMREQGT